MARGSPRRVWQVMVFVACVAVTCTSSSPTSVAANVVDDPEFESAKVMRTSVYANGNGARYRMIEFEVRGRNLASGRLRVRTTNTAAPKGAPCPGDGGYDAGEVWTRKDAALFVVHLPYSARGNLYFCLPVARSDGEIIEPVVPWGGDVEWRHQGNVAIDLDGMGGDLDTDLAHRRKQMVGRKRRNEFPSSKENLRVTGLRVDVAPKDLGIDEHGVPLLQAAKNYTIRLFGHGFTERMKVTFTHLAGVYGGSCLIPTTDAYALSKLSSPESGELVVHLPASDDDKPFYVCVNEGDISSLESFAKSTPFVHQGNDPWVTLRSFEKHVPLWVAILIICLCLTFSALFSGLNLGLMSLDRTELKILCNTGTPKEKQYAKKIQPVRNHGNYLLCSILLGNVLVNSVFTILLDDLTSGLIAVVCSTLAIVMFGEITPQAICSRYGLAIGAKTIVITKLVMALTFPLAYPISKILDVLLGEEIGSVYTRERLKELVKVTTGDNDLDRDEVNIISGALELRKKTVADVMTKIEDAFMLDYETILDFETVSEIMKSGYSRIPVYQNDRMNIITTLFIKDLAFVDPDDNTPLKTLCQFYQNPCNFVFEDVTLDIMFRDFKEGNKGHMAFINRVNNEGEGDPFYETIGLITLEDVIEELIQAEIMDETDVFTDNRSKRKRNAHRTKQDFTAFAERRGENNRIRISPQLTLATFQYLSTSVELFKQPSISETILRRLLKQDIIYHIKKNKDWRNDKANIIYQQGKPTDFFVLILEGRVEVTVGQENLMFESGPFTYFGTQALMQNVGVVESPSALGSLQSLNMDSMLRYTFQPDYTVRACTEVLYMKVKRNLYMAAKRASLMEKSQRDNPTSSDQFDDEVEKFLLRDSTENELSYAESVHNQTQKLLHSLEDDGSIGRNSPELKCSSHQAQPDQPPTTTNAAGTSLNASPRTPSIKSHVSPTTGLSTRPFGSGREINGAVRNADSVDVEEETSSLLQKKS